MIKEFKDFINKGGVFEAAVGLIMALAFVPVVTSLVDDVLLQIIAGIFGQPDFTGISFGLGDADIRIGAFITAIISFVIIAFAVFMMIKVYTMATGTKYGDDDGPSEVDLLIEIRDALRQQQR